MAAPVNYSRGWAMSPTALRTYDARMGRRLIMSVSAGDGPYSKFPPAFAVCSFADDLAAPAGRNPLDYLRELLGPPRHIDLPALGVNYPNYGARLDVYPLDTARLRGVLEMVAAKSGWGGKLPSRQGRGIALPRCFLSYVAVVAHVAVADD